MDDERILESERYQIEQIRELESEELQIEEVEDHNNSSSDEAKSFLFCLSCVDFFFCGQF